VFSDNPELVGCNPSPSRCASRPARQADGKQQLVTNVKTYFPKACRMRRYTVYSSQLMSWLNIPLEVSLRMAGQP
jgi:hypothetical protein